MWKSKLYRVFLLEYSKYLFVTVYLWEGNGVTANKWKPLTYSTVALNVQASIEDHVYIFDLVPPDI